MNERPETKVAGMTAPALRRRFAGWGVWLPGLVVALGAAVATMHGLYEVALASRVPASIAWLYPLITDGLALVAYAATARLTGRAATYAWTVVVIAAGLSGLAQAVFLAAEPPPVPPVLAEPSAVPVAAVLMETSPVLRFGVGAWPATAAAVCAHLLFLLLTDHTGDTAEHSPDGVQPDGRPTVHTAVQPSETAAPSERPNAVEVGGGVQRPALPSCPGPVASDPEVPSEAEVTRPIPVTASPVRAERRAGEPRARDRARTAAERHQARHGELPTVTQLMSLAEVSRGTAGEALKTLREQPIPLHLVPKNPTEKAQP